MYVYISYRERKTERKRKRKRERKLTGIPYGHLSLRHTESDEQ